MRARELRRYEYVNRVISTGGLHTDKLFTVRAQLIFCLWLTVLSLIRQTRPPKKFVIISTIF